MLIYIIGCLIGLAMFVCLRYCLDTPSPCGDGPDFDSLPGYSARPNVIIPDTINSRPYSSQTFQENLYAVYSTYNYYNLLYSKYKSAIDSKTNSLVLYGASAFFFIVFSMHCFPWKVDALRWGVSFLLPVAFYFASSFVYQILPWQFKYDTVKVSSLRFCCDHAAANGFPVTYKELEELEFAPYFSSERFDPFVYHVLKQRTLFMNSVLDSLLFRRKLLKIVEWIFAIIYLFLPRN